MSRKIAFILANAALILPTAAYASCSGNMCKFVAVKETDYGPKDEILKFDVTNKYKRAAMDVIYCIRNAGSTCREETPVGVGPEATKNITVRNVKPNHRVEIISAAMPGCGDRKDGLCAVDDSNKPSAR